jgi:ABC-type sulfate transport system permease component
MLGPRPWIQAVLERIPARCKMVAATLGHPASFPLASFMGRILPGSSDAVLTGGMITLTGRIIFTSP